MPFVKLDPLEMPVGKPQELMNILDSIRMMRTFIPYMGIFSKWTKITIGEYAEKCHNPLLKKFFERAFLPEMSMLFLLFTFVWMNRRSAGYPVGGSLAFAKRIEARYLSLGGKIHIKIKLNSLSLRKEGQTILQA